MVIYKPAEIAKSLGISTSALRHYEAWGVVPPPERAPNGYRLYTGLHMAYFRCLRSMLPGFGYPLTYEVLRHIQNGELDTALWLVSAEQARLQEEKVIAGRTLALLQDPGLHPVMGKGMKHKMSIGEVAAITNVQTSAIRHWEKEGLLSPERNPENGYRLYTPVHARQIMLIRTLRTTVYYLDKMKELVQALEQNSVEKLKEVTEEAMVKIDRRNRQQFNGVHKLVELCIEAGFMDGSEASLTLNRQPYNKEH